MIVNLLVGELPAMMYFNSRVLSEAREFPVRGQYRRQIDRRCDLERYGTSFPDCIFCECYELVEAVRSASGPDKSKAPLLVSYLPDSIFAGLIIEKERHVANIAVISSIVTFVQGECV